MKKIIILLICLAFTLITFAAYPIASISIIKGNVYAKFPDSEQVVKLKKGIKIPEKSVIQTEKNSFIRLLLIDKSQISLGPSSRIKITQYGAQKHGIISLLKGKLRSKVITNYLEDNKKKSKKFYVKTKYAAMGVRGTEFLASYNRANGATSLITFSGEVAINTLDHINYARRVSTNELREVLSQQNTKIVRKKEFSGVNARSSDPINPKRISTVQFETLRRNDGSLTKETKIRDHIPPLVNKSNFKNKSKKLNQLISQISIKNNIKAIKSFASNKNDILKSNTDEFFVDLKSLKFVKNDQLKIDKAINLDNNFKQLIRHRSIRQLGDALNTNINKNKVDTVFNKSSSSKVNFKIIIK